MAFPTLNRTPINVSRTLKDNTIRVEFDGGYEHRRPRYTRDVYRFEITYDLLSSTDIGSLKTHFETVGCHTPFTWTDQESNNHTVYYDMPIKWTYFVSGWYKIDTIQLVEV